MKKILAMFLVMAMMFSAVGCGGGKDPQNQGDNQGSNQQGSDQGNEQNNQNTQNGENNQGGLDEQTDFKVTFTDGGDSKSVEFSRLPAAAEDLEQVDFSNEYQVAAAIVAVLDYYGTDKDACFAMLDVLMGPEDISPYDKDFIKNQYEQYPYVAKSYREGATPENNYDVESIKFVITENIHSRDEENYVKLYFKSGGADSERGVTLRYKPSTSEWFLFSDSYKGLLAGIRVPAKDDKWN